MSRTMHALDKQEQIEPRPSYDSLFLAELESMMTEPAWSHAPFIDAMIEATIRASRKFWGNRRG